MPSTLNPYSTLFSMSGAKDTLEHAACMVNNDRQKREWLTLYPLMLPLRLYLFPPPQSLSPPLLKATLLDKDAYKSNLPSYYKHVTGRDPTVNPHSSMSNLE